MGSSQSLTESVSSVFICSKVLNSFPEGSDPKNADAAFFCGTAAEVIGLESLDETKFLKPWNETVSKKIQDAYKELITSPNPSKGGAIAATQGQLVGEVE